ncbi:MAG TPA: hypothetical protein VFF33_07800 [Ignavibacteriaceae bacterium]|nr:hypothetical protein [Ignavibacteriaceae bacterium]
MALNDKQMVYKILSIIIIVIGVLLLIFKIYSDSEPGAIPLLLIIIGIGFLIYSRNKFK